MPWSPPGLDLHWEVDECPNISERFFKELVHQVNLEAAIRRQRLAPSSKARGLERPRIQKAFGPEVNYTVSLLWEAPIRANLTWTWNKTYPFWLNSGEWRMRLDWFRINSRSNDEEVGYAASSAYTYFATINKPDSYGPDRLTLYRLKYNPFSGTSDWRWAEENTISKLADLIREDIDNDPPSCDDYIQHGTGRPFVGWIQPGILFGRNQKINAPLQSTLDEEDTDYSSSVMTQTDGMKRRTAEQKLAGSAGLHLQDGQDSDHDSEHGSLTIESEEQMIAFPQRLSAPQNSDTEMAGNPWTEDARTPNPKKRIRELELQLAEERKKVKTLEASNRALGLSIVDLEKVIEELNTT